jgi:hypothetical protein
MSGNRFAGGAAVRASPERAAHPAARASRRAPGKSAFGRGPVRAAASRPGRRVGPRSPRSNPSGCLPTLGPEVRRTSRS